MLMMLTACSTATPAPAPTQDLNPLRTEVAGTALAQCAQFCAQTPSATVPPTSTPSPTLTSTPAVTKTQPTTTGTVINTIAASTNDRARWVSQNIQDGAIFTPGTAFTMTWQIQNVGTTTWTTDYRLRFYSGNSFGAPTEIPLGKEVPPEEVVEITVPMRAPAAAAEYRSDWVLSNELRSNFKEPVFLKIKVVNAATATALASGLLPTATRNPDTVTPLATTTP